MVLNPNKNCRIDERISILSDDSIHTNWTWKIELKTKSEYKEFQGPSEIISKFEFSASVDKFKWFLEPNGQFSAGSLRKALVTSSKDKIQNPIFWNTDSN